MKGIPGKLEPLASVFSRLGVSGDDIPNSELTREILGMSGRPREGGELARQSFRVDLFATEREVKVVAAILPKEEIQI